MMLRALAIFTSKTPHSCELSDREYAARLVVMQVMSGWKMPLLYRGTCCDGWNIQGKRARGGAMRMHTATLFPYVEVLGRC